MGLGSRPSGGHHHARARVAAVSGHGGCRIRSGRRRPWATIARSTGASQGSPARGCGVDRDPGRCRSWRAEARTGSTRRRHDRRRGGRQRTVPHLPWPSCSSPRPATWMRHRRCTSKQVGHGRRDRLAAIGQMGSGHGAYVGDPQALTHELPDSTRTGGRDRRRAPAPRISVAHMGAGESTSTRVPGDDRCSGRRSSMHGSAIGHHHGVLAGRRSGTCSVVTSRQVPDRRTGCLTCRHQHATKCS